jgi:hypothetical protein
VVAEIDGETEVVTVLMLGELRRAEVPLASLRPRDF